MLKTATFFSSLGVVLAVFSFPGKPRPAAVAPSGVFRVDAQHSDAQMITDATTNYGRNKITFTTGIARIAGKVSLDDANPEKSSFDITMYPATSVEPSMNEEGKVKTEWLASFAYQTLVCFHSKGAYITPDGKWKTTGYLAVTRVDRNIIDTSPTEAYSGPVYGPPVIHRVTHPASFVFDIPFAASASPALVASGSTNVLREDFPQLVRVVLNTYWPPVVQDEHCTQPSFVGEDYSGPKCTGTFLHAPGLPEESRIVGEDYPALPSNFSSVVGEHLTIAVHLQLQPGAAAKAD